MSAKAGERHMIGTVSRLPVVGYVVKLGFMRLALGYARCSPQFRHLVRVFYKRSDAEAAGAHWVSLYRPTGKDFCRVIPIVSRSPA